ncbi:MAG: site-specific DNA-methyltransferase [bacterium]|nr:site-specific DNA-methyltransferase [bacterium]
MAKNKISKNIETLRHREASRKNIPTAEYQPVMRKKEQSPVRVAYERRNRDLDPQLVWRGKDGQDWSDLVVHAPPLYIQEKVHPKVLIDDLRQQTEKSTEGQSGFQTDLFADFNGLPNESARTEFYQHDANWSNRMILGDSLHVMASLAEREGLRGKVQCIYFDPPYGIKFNSNFQWSTTSRDVKDGKADHITREPEQVKAFRDTWRDGIHSYLTYLRDRLTVARDLLADSGSIFVQIGDENVHLVRALMDEVFGNENFCAQICFSKTGGLGSQLLYGIFDFILWYAKDKNFVKNRNLFLDKELGGEGASKYKSIELSSGKHRPLTKEELNNPQLIPSESRIFRLDNLTSQGNEILKFKFCKKKFAGGWKTNVEGMKKLVLANRIVASTNSLNYVRYLDDFAAQPMTTYWPIGGIQSRADPKVYVVQTATEAIKRCILMTTDPGDLVLDPTCGSGSTAYVAEQWGRRWITIDTSRVALTLARARIMGARYPYYLLVDSREGQQKEADLTRSVPSDAPTYGNIRQGFVYQRVPHITLKSIANNTEIDEIWERFQETLEPLRQQLNQTLSTSWEEWEIPREAEGDWPQAAKELHSQWWQQRIVN